MNSQRWRQYYTPKIPHHASSEEKAYMVKNHLKGTTQLAEDLNLTYHQVCYFLHKAGLVGTSLLYCRNRKQKQKSSL